MNAREKQSEKVTDIDQRGGETYAEDLAELFELPPGCLGKMNRATGRFEVDNSDENSCGIAGDGRPSGSRDAPFENRHIYVVADQVDNVRDDRQESGESSHSVGTRVCGGLVDRGDHRGEHPQRQQILHDEIDELFIVLSKDLSGRRHQRNAYHRYNSGRGDAAPERECKHRVGGLLVALAFVDDRERIAAEGEHRYRDTAQKDDGGRQVYRVELYGAEELTDHDPVENARQIG